MDKSKIVILSTVINTELYQKSSQLFPENIQKYVIDGKNGMYGLDSIFFMMKKLKNKDIDWLIMADEDVLFQNTNLIFNIINKMESEKHIVCGIRDGGLISHREQNPYLINTFFSIVNFKELELIWNKKQIIKNNFLIENEFKDNLKNLHFEFDIKSLYEPYYCFYLWLRRKNKKFLFLDSNQPIQNDKISNAVYFEGELLLYHTWYARSYGNNKKHTDRIDKIFELLNFNSEHNIPPVIFKDNTFFIRKFLRKQLKRMEMKIQIYFK